MQAESDGTLILFSRWKKRSSFFESPYQQTQLKQQKVPLQGLFIQPYGQNTTLTVAHNMLSYLCGHKGNNSESQRTEIAKQQNTLRQLRLSKPSILIAMPTLARLVQTAPFLLKSLDGH